MRMRYKRWLFGSVYFGLLAVIAFVFAGFLARDDGQLAVLFHALVPTLHVVGWFSVASCVFCLVMAVWAVSSSRRRHL